MLVIVPGEKLLAEGAAVLNTAETIRETGPVFHRAKLAFRIGIVVGNIGSAVRLGDAKVGHQECDWFGAHDFSSVSLNGQLAARDGVFLRGVLNEVFGKFGRFPLGDHPAGDVAAEDVDHYVKLEVVPFGRTAEFGDVPAPQWIWRVGEQFLFLMDRRHGLIAAIWRFRPSRTAIRRQGEQDSGVKPNSNRSEATLVF